MTAVVGRLSLYRWPEQLPDTCFQAPLCAAHEWLGLAAALILMVTGGTTHVSLTRIDEEQGLAKVPANKGCQLALAE
jgi:hypothetical protein